MRAEAAVDAGAAETDVDAVRDGGPGGVLGGAVEANLRGVERSEGEQS